MTVSVQSQPWERPDKPIFSNAPPPQAWMRCNIYCPRVIYAEGKYRMWFSGSDVRPTLYRSCIGYAESDDGLAWTLYPGNPILTADGLSWGQSLHTPRVLFDEEERLYKMWFLSTTHVEYRDDGILAKDIKSDLGYATSRDGIHWDFWPEPLIEECRAPCIHKEVGRYRMWLNASPNPEDSWETAYRYVYEYWSEDGITWTRHDRPAVQATGNTRSCVYPDVHKINGTYYMWHIGHLKKKDGPMNLVYHEIFCDTSKDGSTWTLHHETPAFAASRDLKRFDWKTVSTPCVVDAGDMLRLYYAGCNLKTNFNLFEGGDNGEGMHIAVATMAKERL